MLEQQARTFHLLGKADLADAAATLGVPRSTLYAVMSVETAGLGFLLDGRPKILFERHIMYRRLLCAGLDANACAARDPEIVNTRPGGYAGGAAEYERLARAITISRTAALESCSWGLFQVMGFHWQLLGYASVQRFVEAMEESERRQLDAFAAFIHGNPALHRALQARNWANFAEGYNGRNYRANAYDVRLAEAYAHFDALVSPRAA
ncbi:N-acetylmuramidase family protein [Trinickia terrae]|nr:N-acetylmuramidase family protein [Trinickia terrae]